MKPPSETTRNQHSISRRDFVKFGAVAAAASAVSYSPLSQSNKTKDEDVKVKRYNILGRTGFNISDISMGCIGLKEPNIVRYAYEKGINYFDTAEGYGNGESEKTLGDSLKLIDRKKIFITTKLQIKAEETADQILERFRKCQERLQTEYVDALFMHSVSAISLLHHPGFHTAANHLKTEGRLKHIGVSSHGPRGREGDSMATVLCAAAEDGRFDLMLLVYNFMNFEDGGKILAACKKHNVGNMAMKTAPGVLAVTPFDPEHPTPQQQEIIENRIKQGASREQVIERFQERYKQQLDALEKTKPFLQKYGISTEDHLRKASIQWVIQNPDLHSACIALREFDLIDNVVPLSGTKLSTTDIEFLHQFKWAFNDKYCRHGCNACAARCPHQLPVSTIMRYAYYFACHGREKYAMQKYADLKDGNAIPCLSCDAPCRAACPYQVDIQANLCHAHELLTLA